MRHAICVLIAAGALLLSSCGQKPPARAKGGKFRVVATIFPLADAARQVGGRHAEVVTLLRPGVSAHDYTATPADAQALAQADLLLMVGLGLDDWAEQAGRSTAGKKLRVYRMSDSDSGVAGVSPASGPATTATAAAAPVKHDADEQDEHDAHAHAGDPHLWLDPLRMRQYVLCLAGVLGELDPAHAADYHANATVYAAQIEQLDAEYRQRLAPCKGRAFASFHPAFTYLADRYGLEQIGLQRTGEAGLTPAQLEKVAQFIRQKNVKVIFTEPQFPSERLARLAELTGTRIGTLDPLGNPGQSGYDNYLAMMRSNLAQLEQGLAGR